MKIKLDKLHTLWYENESGDVHEVNYGKGEPETPPKGYVYQHSMFPTQLTHNILRDVVEEEVAACKHPDKHVVPTSGWIDGMEGRECNKCKGSQVKKKEVDWPKKWDANGSRQVMAFNMGWSEDLAMGLTNSGDYTLSQAILIAAQSCERCMNVLIYEHVTKDDGYPEYSDEWKKTNTECAFCKDEKAVKAKIMAHAIALGPYEETRIVRMVSKTKGLGRIAKIIIERKSLREKHHARSK